MYGYDEENDSDQLACRKPKPCANGLSIAVGSPAHNGYTRYPISGVMTSCAAEA